MVRVEITDLTKPQKYQVFTAPRAHSSSTDQKKNTGGNLMPNILEDLYYGNVSPCERRVRPGRPAQKAMQKRDEIETKLNVSLSDEQKAEFSRYLEISAEVLDSCCLDSFITGFRLGARLTHDTFIGTDAPYTDMLNEKA